MSDVNNKKQRNRIALMEQGLAANREKKERGAMLVAQEKEAAALLAREKSA